MVRNNSIKNSKVIKSNAPKDEKPYNIDTCKNVNKNKSIKAKKTKTKKRTRK